MEVKDEPVKDESSAGESSLRAVYGELALKVARYAVIAHSSGRPLKRRDLMQELKPVNGDLGRQEFSAALKRAKEFLRDKLGMTIVELKPVKLRGTQFSPARDEYMVVSLSHSHRSMLHKVSSRRQVQVWGILCFALMFIVLKGDGVTYEELLAGLYVAKLLDPRTEEENRVLFSETLQDLLAQRVLETTKDTNAPAGGETEQRRVAPPVDLYFMGPYVKHLISARELFLIILRWHYPNENVTSREFQETSVVTVRSLKQKLESTPLGAVAQNDNDV